MMFCMIIEIHSSPPLPSGTLPSDSIGCRSRPRYRNISSSVLSKLEPIYSDEEVDREQHICPPPQIPARIGPVTRSRSRELNCWKNWDMPGSFLSWILKQAITSTSIEEHLEHLHLTFAKLQENHLVVKQSKCDFVVPRITYLGHIISAGGVSADPSKIEAMKNWPHPHDITSLRGFLGLIGYYCRFIHHYGKLAALLTSLLKNSFHWSAEADRAFLDLKEALSSSPVLQLPDFSDQFVIECDASGSGIGAVLMQQGHPIAYYSRKMGPKHLHLSAYERELIGLAKSIQHWRSYLWGVEFLVWTDHLSLKYILEQRITTIPQQHWLRKLLIYDLKVEYKPGKENSAADALSRQHSYDQASTCCALTQEGLLETIRTKLLHDTSVPVLRDRLNATESTTPFSWRNGLLWFENRLYLPTDSVLPALVVATLHDLFHEGYLKTLYRIRADFYWPKMKDSIQSYVAACPVCQRFKSQNLQPAGLLQPLPILLHIWADISMDFIEHLPFSAGKTVLLVVVDRFTKMAHFSPLKHPYTASSVARLFFQEVFRLHGLPESIVCDSDVTFTSLFWKELFHLSGAALHFTTAYHPQADGQTEVVNRIIQAYLRCFSGDHPSKWIENLCWAEYAYNTSFHTSLKTTPFEAVYGCPPPCLMDYVPGLAKVDFVDNSLKKRHELLEDLRERLFQAQNRAIQQHNAKHRDLTFALEDWMLLKLQPYRQTSLGNHHTRKLTPVFYGPFQVHERVGAVAYRLALPEEARIHPVFHVSKLRKFVGTPPDTPKLPTCYKGRAHPIPHAVMDSRVHNDVPQLLVH